jgi:hypothetical protein
MAIKNEMVGIKIAKQASKGAPKDGCARDVTPRKEVGGPYNNPSKVQAKGMEHKVGKLGK